MGGVGTCDILVGFGWLVGWLGLWKGMWRGIWRGGDGRGGGWDGGVYIFEEDGRVG